MPDPAIFPLADPFAGQAAPISQADIVTQGGPGRNKQDQLLPLFAVAIRFRNVVSHCGSFTAIRGGNLYPALIRRSTPRPLRVFLQTGSRDLDVVYGNWVIANQDMAAARAYKQYDHQLVVGEGGHSLAHGGALFPDTMRWIWRDYPR